MSQNLTKTGKRFDLNGPNTKTRLDAQEKKSLCCAAVGITTPSSSATEALIPHEKLREAASPDASLTAQNGPLAQPVVGYTHPLSARSVPNVSDGHRLWTVEPASHQKSSKHHQIEVIGQPVREINHGS
ncbi:hypothetical protein [Pseudomonas serbica]